MLRSTQTPNLRLGRPFLAALGGVLLPAIPAFLILWGSNADVQRILIHADPFRHLHWLLAAGLSSAALFAWISVPVATVVIWGLARSGWAGPLGIVASSLLIGLPVAHVVFHGDLTTEAPDMLPVLSLTLIIQALCAWAVLWLTGAGRSVRGGLEKNNTPQK